MKLKPLDNPLHGVVHLGYLDSLRALAALYVVLQHVVLQVSPSGELNSIGFLKRFFYLFRYGHYAVDLFIVLSGFCLMLPVIRNHGKLREGALNFFKKRIRRILPPYYLATGLSLILIASLIGSKTGTHWDVSIPVTSNDVMTHLLLVQDVFSETAPKINHSLWSISVEWRIYFLFPLLIFLWRVLGAVRTTLVALALSSSLFLVLSYLPALNLNLTPWGICPHYIGLFTLGMFAAEISYSEEITFNTLRQHLPWKTLTVIATGNALIVYVLVWETRLWMMADLSAGLWAVCLLVTASLGQARWLNKVLAWKPLVSIGSFAYSLYLIHAPLLQVISQYVLEPLKLTLLENLIILFVAGTPAIVGCSFLFFLLFERPFLTKRKVANYHINVNEVNR